MRRAGLVVVLVIGLVFAPTLASAKAPRVIDPSARPHGQSYGEWGAAWWQWALAQPTDTNPVLDVTGEDCTNGQSGRVWFLAGTIGGVPVERNCTVPRGTMLFFPIVNAMVSTAGDSSATEAELRDAVETIMDDATGLEVTIDGAPIGDLSVFRVQSPLFEFTVPGDNFIGIAAGTYSGVTDGYYLMIPPLRPGAHTIEFAGELLSFGFSLDVVYNLTVGS